MKHCLSFSIVALFALCFVARPTVTADAQGRSAAPSQATHVSEFAADVQRMVDADQAKPPPQPGILFIGSSIFVRWSDLSHQMDPLPVYNRAFGGSRTWEILHYMDQLVLPNRPAVIVYYCGSNDINSGEPPSPIAERFEQFSDRVHQQLPATRILYVSIIRAPQKMSHWDDVDKANALVKAYCRHARNTAFLDVNPVFFKDGQPRMELYVEDHLHLQPEAYVEMSAIVRPAVEKAYKSAKR